MPSVDILSDKPPSAVDGGAQLVEWLRAQRERHAVSFSEEFGMYHVFRYAEVKEVLSDPHTYSSDMITGLIPDEEQKKVGLFFEHHLGKKDPPSHRIMRGLFNQAFTPRMVAQLEDRVTEMTSGLLDDAGTGEVDLVVKLSYRLPVTIIAEILGIPPADENTFMRWADALLAVTGQEEGFPEDHVPDVADALSHPLMEIQNYLIEHCADRRERPGDDLISRLGQSEMDGHRLSNDEVTALAMNLLVSGYFTATMLIGNCLLFLCENPSVQAQLRADPSGLPAHIDEILRLRPSLTRNPRRIMADTTLGGVDLKAGAPLVVWMAAANRDPLVFDDPDTFNPLRDPNPHLSFGHGSRFCLGANLARLEAKVALEQLFARYRPLTMVPGSARFHDNSDTFGLRSLTLNLER
ncbi:cytochrome P450 [Lentzea sp. NBRC 105346]|uniref:cytochrome P450 n=1 Tax=Lentzea sp. NBRC 105346 TaxID=3032205 RepID=UPI0024A46E07|nr:cytochrome P450 [Lentzea sp. NBRC 105346]GLZ28509.1 cytochrome P450 [Lentzea sp. NBRC 105346]